MHKNLPGPNYSFNLKTLNQFQQLRASPQRVLIPALSLWDRSIMVHKTWVNVCAQRPSEIIFMTVVSDLRGWIYYLLSAITSSTGSAQTKASDSSHFVLYDMKWWQ